MSDDIESAEEFVQSIYETLDPHAGLSGNEAAIRVRARDAAVRAAALEETIAELKRLWYREHNAVRHRRLVDGSPFVVDECIAYVRALADKEPQP